MILFPAIDLKDGACVRLKEGDMAHATLFNTDPLAQAREFLTQGFEWLHIVDLNGAFAGKPVNAQAVESILAGVPLKVQLGGGIRDLATIDAWLERKVARVILGTLAVREPDLVRAAARMHPGHVAVSIDARAGKVAVEGWAQTSTLDVLDLARRLEDIGVAALIYTDIARDGLLKGINIDATIALARAVSVPVIASGGLSGLDDLKALKTRAVPNLIGAIAGRALYDGRLDAKAALQLLAGKG
jgi:phosphoribosylformimino-5-aminoimidazole carboxamide ribotide isomerase